MTTLINLTHGEHLRAIVAIETAGYRCRGGLRDFQATCPRCQSALFATQYHHVDAAHKTKVIYQCRLCGGVYVEVEPNDL
jgi:hypothetical protein